MNSSAALADSRLRIIVGPTAAGKSHLAMRLAERYGAAIVSADSRQIYRGFDIGTGKPTRADRERIVHYGVDVAEPTVRWSAAQFTTEAEQWLVHVHNTAGQTPVVVGGTGFWIKALVTPLAPIPDLDPARRTELERDMAAKTRDELRAWCTALDPEIARHGPVQWRRAIEVTLLTGTPLSEWHRQAASVSRPARYLVVDPVESLQQRIAARVNEMIAAGWAAEVQALSAVVPHSAIAWNACGYGALRAALEAGQVSTDVVRDVVQETWQYARRQRTWFRTQLKAGRVTRVDPTAPDTWDRACAWWEGDDEA